MGKTNAAFGFIDHVNPGAKRLKLFLLVRAGAGEARVGLLQIGRHLGEDRAERGGGPGRYATIRPLGQGRAHFAQRKELKPADDGKQLAAQVGRVGRVRIELFELVTHSFSFCWIG